MKRMWWSGSIAAVGVTALLVASAPRVGSQPSAAPGVSIGPSDLGGVVTSRPRVVRFQLRPDPLAR